MSSTASFPAPGDEPPITDRAARARGALGFLRRAYREVAGLGQTVLLNAPSDIPAQARLWAAWGGQLRKAVLIDPEQAFVYVSVPKAANSTIKRILWRRLGVELSGRAVQRTLHLNTGPYLSLFDLAFNERNAVFTKPSVFRFSFVRNPYARLRSAYLQKLIQPDAFDRPEHYLASLGWRSPHPPTFEAFIRRVVAQSDTQMNIHWKPQHRCLAYDGIAYDFVGRVENFDDDIRAVLARIGEPQSSYDPAISLNRRGSEQEDRAQYTEGLAELVYGRFRRDFEYFNYGADSYRAADLGLAGA